MNYPNPIENRFESTPSRYYSQLASPSSLAHLIPTTGPITPAVIPAILPMTPELLAAHPNTECFNKLDAANNYISFLEQESYEANLYIAFLEAKLEQQDDLERDGRRKEYRTRVHHATNQNPDFLKVESIMLEI